MQNRIQQSWGEVKGMRELASRMGPHTSKMVVHLPAVMKDYDCGVPCDSKGLRQFDVIIAINLGQQVLPLGLFDFLEFLSGCFVLGSKFLGRTHGAMGPCNTMQRKNIGVGCPCYQR